jgi:uncharacterized protein YycO
MSRSGHRLREFMTRNGGLIVTAALIIAFAAFFTLAFIFGSGYGRRSGASRLDLESTSVVALSMAGAGRNGAEGGNARSVAEPESAEDILIPGDILLGRCELSLVPSMNPLEGWTHVALYIVSGKIMVASNPNTGVVRSYLSSWDYPKMTWVSYLRVLSADDEVRQKAVDFAVERRGQPYDANWFSQQVDGDSWYCSEFVWAAYMQASGGRIDLAHGPDLFGVSPDDIYRHEDTVVIGGHYERKPDTGLSLLMKVFGLCILLGGSIAGPESMAAIRGRRPRRGGHARSR